MTKAVGPGEVYFLKPAVYFLNPAGDVVEATEYIEPAKSVSRSTVTDFVEALGLDPGEVASVRIEPERVFATVYARVDNHRVLVGNEFAKGQVTVPIVD